MEVIVTKQANHALMIIIRIVSGLLGYVAAISFIRAVNRTFEMQIRRHIGARFNFGLWPSVLFLLICMGLFAFSILYGRRKSAYPLRRVDYLYLLTACGLGFLACGHSIWRNRGFWMSEMPVIRTGIAFIPGFNAPIYLSLIAYALALTTFGELLARQRDRTLAQTVYWVRFFKVFSVWQPVGFFTLLLLGAQVLLAVLLINNTFVWGVVLFTLGGLTYFAARMLNLSRDYDMASKDKIQAERFKSELVTNVSHDIKTPLTSIINYVDLLRNEGLEGQAGEYVDVLVRKSARLKVLIDDLMEASKAGTGNLRVELLEVNLAEIVGQVAGEFEDRFNDRELTLVIRQGRPMTVLADSRHLYRALENLFSNAAKYAFSGTRVFAEITALPYHEGKALFTLQNTSADPIDIPPGELTEQFMRNDKARHTEGSGLGLYIAKSLVELMGGSLEIRVVGDLFRVEVVLLGDSGGGDAFAGSDL